MNPKTIIVPLDGSTFAEFALPHAVALADHLGVTQIELVSVYNDEPVAGGWALSGERIRDSFDQYQRHLVERLRPLSGARLVPLVLAGSVPQRLEEYVERQRPALVVMSTHGRGPASRAWLGSVADRLIRHVTTPILLVRPSEDEEADLAVRPDLRRLLVPLDGSGLAERALPLATSIAGPASATVRLVRVVGPHYAVSPYLPHTIAETREATERERDEAKRYLSQQAEGLKREGLAVETEVPVGVSPARGILRAAEQEPTDLIVMATHGHGGIKRAVLGSVADKVVRASPLPVLVARPVGD